MTDTHNELLTIADELKGLAARGVVPEVREPLQNLRQAAEEVGKAWSGSWLGYHANVYHRDLRPPPPGTHFSPEWGIGNTAFVQGSTGDWVEYNPDQVRAFIHQRAGNPNMNPVENHNEDAGGEFRRQKNNLLSIVEIETSHSKSQFLVEKKEELSKLSLISEADYLKSWTPTQSVSRDSLALHQGHWTPPHVKVLAQVVSMQTTVAVTKALADIAQLVASHILRDLQQPNRGAPVGKRVFIGHGRSHIWRELKDFLEDDLELLVDEFNRVPAAGVSITSRLSTILDSAAIALLVMTGEDEQADGALRARENVVHEAGLFQGRLGFERAIVLLEDGCAKFSNNAGLVHINFPKNNIRASFQDIRDVLEREGILTSGATP